MPVDKAVVQALVRQGAVDVAEKHKLLRLAAKSDLWEGLEKDEVLGVLRLALAETAAESPSERQCNKRLRLDVDALQARARTSVTSAQTTEAQGKAILDLAAIDDVSVTADLPGWTCSQAVKDLVSQLHRQHQPSLDSATQEGPVQAFLTDAMPKLLALDPTLNRSAHDTHLSGLSTTGGSGHLLPDQCVCNGLEVHATQIDTIIEAKTEFNTKALNSAAFQVQQRGEQLHRWQPRRYKVVVATISRNEIILWKMLFVDKQASPSSVERTILYPFKLEVQSSGLQLLVRYCQAPSQSLGWTPPTMPSNLQLGTQPLTALRHLVPETTSRAAIVVRGIQGDSEIVAKASLTNPQEFENYSIVEELSLCETAQDGVAKCLGTMREGDRVTWMFLEHCGKTLTQAAQGDPLLLSKIICQRNTRSSGGPCRTLLGHRSRRLCRDDQQGQILLEMYPQLAVVAKKTLPLLAIPSGWGSLFLQAAKIASRLWQADLVHGDLSPSNIMYQNNIVKLIDLQTLHKPKVSSGPTPITGTPQFIALSRLQRQPATLATELESLAYCFMHSATKYRLHWSHAVPGTPHAIDMKAAAMAWPEYFEEVVIKRIPFTTLHQPARQLRELFSPCGHSASITMDKFLSCF